MTTLLRGAIGILIVLMPQLCSGQPEWGLIQPRPTNENLRTVFFSSPATGFIVGDYGTILRSTDGGDSWEVQPSGTIYTLKSVRFFNDQLGIVVGEHGTILRTTDGGSTWAPQPCPTTSHLSGVAFASKDTPDVVFAVGYDATVLRSNDQGQTWVHVDVGVPATSRLEDITFTSEGWGAIVGFYRELYSFDGGATWVNRSISTIIMSKVCAVSAHSFAAAGMYNSSPDYWWGLWLVKDTATNYSRAINSYGKIISAHFINEQSGCLVGDAIHRTDDGGVTWTEQLRFRYWTCNDVFFTDSLNGTVIGDDGTILRTRDAGATWSQLFPLYSQQLMSVSFVNAQVGLAVGFGSEILSTSDGGLSWGTRSFNERLYLTRISHITDSIVLAVGGSGIIVRSSDGGVQWKRYKVAYNTLNDIVFIDDEIGIIIGDAGYIAGTMDAGLTWTRREQNITTSDFVAGIYIRENEVVTLFALASDGIILNSTDAGATWHHWSTLPSGECTDVAFLDAATAFVCGRNGMMVKTTDAGASWQEVQHGGGDEHLHRIVTQRFESEVIILATGGYGMILHTVDGGMTWLRHQTATRYEIFDAHFTDSLTGIAVGARATILRTSNGGLTWAGAPDHIPSHLSLGQHYPNPVSTSTTIPFTLTKTEHVTLSVYDMLGRRVAVLVDDVRTAGTHMVSFNSKGLVPGIYFYTLSSGSGRRSGKMTIVNTGSTR